LLSHGPLLREQCVEAKLVEIDVHLARARCESQRAHTRCAHNLNKVSAAARCRTERIAGRLQLHTHANSDHVRTSEHTQYLSGCTSRTPAQPPVNSRVRVMLHFRVKYEIAEFDVSV
jgi:hypothetical protein